MLLQFAFSLLALPLFGLANPVLNKGAVSDANFTTISYYGQYAAASYCRGNLVDIKQTKISCGELNANNCVDASSADHTIIDRFVNISDTGPAGTGTTGLIAVDRSKKLIVVSFRGAQTLANIKNTFNLGLVNANAICKGCTVHKGINQAWVDVKPRVVAKIKEALGANPGFRVVSVGHSLGAAVATIAAVDLRRNSNLTVDLAAFASSRVGNSVFAAAASVQTKGQNFRVVQLGDPVAELPPRNTRFNGHYAHILPAFRIDTSTRPDRSGPNKVTAANLNIDNIDSEALPALSAFNVAAHNWYINNIADCGEHSVLEISTKNKKEIDGIIARTVLKFPDLLKLLPLTSLVNGITLQGVPASTITAKGVLNKGEIAVVS